jgi:hypothetical protein
MGNRTQIKELRKIALTLSQCGGRGFDTLLATIYLKKEARPCMIIVQGFLF